MDEELALLTFFLLMQRYHQGIMAMTYLVPMNIAFQHQCKFYYLG